MNRLQSIQNRLIITFLGVVLLSLSGITLMQVLSGSRTAQEEINRQLTTVVTFKTRIITEWLNTLKAELGNVLVGETTLADVQRILQSEGQVRSADRRALRSDLLAAVSNSRYYYEFFLMNQQGVVILSTLQAHEGRSYAGEEFFEAADRDPVIGRPFYSADESNTVLFVAYPIQGRSRQPIGVLAGRARYDPMDQIFRDNTGTREQANTFLLDQAGVAIAGSDPARLGRSFPALAQALTGAPPIGVTVLSYVDPAGVPITGAYERIPDLNGVLLVEQASLEVARTWAASLAVNFSVTLSSVLVALFLALLSTHSIANPLTDLVDIATRITRSAGDAAWGLETADEAGGGPLEAEARELDERARGWQHEIGAMASAFNRMTRRLSGLIAGLEARVEERTRALEQHSRYLEASADVSRAATLILDLDRLIAEAVQLIRDRFDLYYVGLFLTEPDGLWAVLRAGTGDAGKAMLERNHRLRIEPTSMIGWCISNDQPRIAQVASDDEVRVVNPELPETRSEAALPLHARGQVIGALTVQSTVPNAFDPAALQVLQTMADQIAIAIDNAVLFSRSREALEAERRAYSLNTASEWEAWRRSLAAPPDRAGLSLRRNLDGRITPLKSWTEDMEQAFRAQKTVIQDNRLAVPIRIRGQVIGVIQADTAGSAPHHRSTEKTWNGETVNFIESIADQLGAALDSARLYAETRKRAEQDRLVDELTERIRATLDIQTVLETAAQEMRTALGLAEVEVRLGEPSGDGGDPE